MNDVKQGVADSASLQATLRNLHRQFYGAAPRAKLDAVLMDYTYAATLEELVGFGEVLEDDVRELYQQYGPAGEASFEEQLKFIAAHPELKFSVGLDTGKRV